MTRKVPLVAVPLIDTGCAIDSCSTADSGRRPWWYHKGERQESVSSVLSYLHSGITMSKDLPVRQM